MFLILPLGTIYLLKIDRNTTDKYIDNHRNYLEQVLNNIDSSFSAYEQLIFTTVKITEELPADKSEHEAALKLAFSSSRSALVYGIGIWYEPYSFDEKTERFGPYINYIDANKDKVEITYFWNTPEYNYHDRKWYKTSLAAKEGQTAVTPPYFDSDYTYITFGKPFYKEGQRAGVVTVDIVLPQLQDYLSDYDFSDFSGVYLTTRDHSIVFSKTDAGNAAFERHALEGEQLGHFIDMTAVYNENDITSFFEGIGQKPELLTSETENGVFRIHAFLDRKAILRDIIFQHTLQYLIFFLFWITVLYLILFSSSYLKRNYENRLLNTENERLKEEIFKRKEAESRLTFHAYYDEVSGLQNLNSFMEKEEAPQIENDSRSLIQISLNNMKELSLILSGTVIDETLLAFTTRLKNVCPLETRLYRARGFSFFVVFDDRETGSSQKLAEKLLNEFRFALRLGSRDIRLRAKIGLVYFKDAESLEQVLVMSQSTIAGQDEADSGKVALFDRSIQDQKARHFVLDAAMSQPGFIRELHMLYQYIVKTEDRAPAGFEALMRWDSSVLGSTISPGEFIPLAEENGMIISLGWFAIKEVLKALSGPLVNSDLFVTVNVSPIQFIELGFPDKLDKLLRKYSVEKSRLKLEITESSAAAAIESFWQIIDELIRRGYRLAIDDFGTGESSFHRLYNMAFDTLKIDRSFITGIDQEERNQEICRSLMDIGKTMGSQIVAEGVETEEEHRVLREIGIKYTQGYLYARPQPLSETEFG
jgi:EAL domain-containing protein (putative c-di-GMP-specific phosphodiesterase class I)/GGDEF domain-containing protein